MTNKSIYNNNDSNNDPNDDSFTVMGSVSDLKSVPSSPTVLATPPLNSPIQSSESEEETSESGKLKSHRDYKQKKWPKFKRFKDPRTGEESIYELIEPQPEKGFFTLCSELVTLSSISLFVASNLFAFTVGMLVGKQIAYEF